MSTSEMPNLYLGRAIFSTQNKSRCASGHEGIRATAKNYFNFA